MFKVRDKGVSKMCFNFVLRSACAFLAKPVLREIYST